MPLPVQVHSATRHVEYRGEIIDFTDSLLQLPAGGQTLLSDTTFQHIGGRLHEVKLPSQFQLPSDGQSLKLEGHLRAPEGQSLPVSRRTSLEATAKPLVYLLTQASHTFGAASAQKSCIDCIFVFCNAMQG